MKEQPPGIGLNHPLKLSKQLTLFYEQVNGELVSKLFKAATGVHLHLAFYPCFIGATSSLYVTYAQMYGLSTVQAFSMILW